MRRLEFSALQVRDLAFSKAFYINKLGFEESEMSNPEAVIFKFNKGEASFAIRNPLEILDQVKLGVGVSHWFAIDGTIDELQSKLLANEVTLAGPIIPTPFGKTIHVIDPDGYKLVFLEKKEGL